MTNEHATQYLNDYFKLTISPQYAVMLTGAWGSGKTHFIKSFFPSIEPNRTKSLLTKLWDLRPFQSKTIAPSSKELRPHYIGLYGFSKTSEIDDEIYASFHPLLADKSVKFAGKLLAMAVKARIDFTDDGKSDVDATLNPKIDLSSIMNSEGNPKSIFIFDDFERCDIDKSALLGYINYFVEHVGAKVVILSNSEKITDEKFDSVKEKVIGQVLEIQTDVDSALQQFRAPFDAHGFGKVLRENQPLIKEVFTFSDYKNLRSLRAAFISIHRVYEALPQKAKDSDAYCKELLTLLIPLCLEVSAGKDINSLLGYWSTLSRGEKDDENSQIRKKYPMVNWAQVSDPERSLWTDFFKKGFVDASRLSEIALANHVFSTENTPDWIKLCQYFYLDQETFEQVRKDVYQQLTKHEFKDIDQILLLFGMYMSLSKQGFFSDKSSDELVNETKDYIEYLNQNSHADYESFFGLDGTINRGLGGYGGFGIPSSEGIHEIQTWLFEEHERYIKAKQTQMAQSLIDEIKQISKGYDALQEKFNLNGEYRQFPIFAQVSPEDVLEALQTLPTAFNWHAFSYIVQSRFKYTNVNSYQPYISELDFYQELSGLLTTFISENTGNVVVIGAEDLQGTLSEVIGKLEALPKSQTSEAGD